MADQQPSSSDPSACEPLDETFAVVYEELRRLARWHMSGEAGHHTLQATALIHEVYVKLAASPDLSFRNREHFLVVASTAMRRVLVDHARRRRSQKRGGALVPIEFGDLLTVHNDVELIDLDRALSQLIELDPRAGRIFELTVFGGMSAVEIAKMFELSDRMIRYELAHARAWVLQRLQPGTAGDRFTA